MHIVAVRGAKSRWANLVRPEPQRFWPQRLVTGGDGLSRVSGGCGRHRVDRSASPSGHGTPTPRVRCVASRRGVPCWLTLRAVDTSLSSLSVLARHVCVADSMPVTVLDKSLVLRIVPYAYSVYRRILRRSVAVNRVRLSTCTVVSTCTLHARFEAHTSGPPFT